jgi:hypothetical protein
VSEKCSWILLSENVFGVVREQELMGYFHCFGMRKKGKGLKLKDEEVRNVEDNRKPAGIVPASSSGEFV